MEIVLFLYAQASKKLNIISLRLVFIFPAVLAGGHAHGFFEQIAEIMGVVVPYGKGHLGGPHAAQAQKLLGLADAQGREVFGSFGGFAFSSS